MPRHIPDCFPPRLLSCLAGPRRFIWRRTIGRFRSEEAVYKSAERQYQTLAETLDGQVRPSFRP